MGQRLMLVAREIKSVTRGAKAVLEALCFAASDRTRVAWVTVDRLAEWSGLHKRSVIRATRRLEDLGYVTVVRGGGRAVANGYHVLPREEVGPWA